MLMQCYLEFAGPSKLIGALPCVCVLQDG